MLAYKFLLVYGCFKSQKGGSTYIKCSNEYWLHYALVAMVMLLTFHKPRWLYLKIQCQTAWWASVSEPHTCDFNAAFSLLVTVLMLYISSHILSKIAIKISIFHLGSYIRGMRTPGSAPWPANNSVDGSTGGKCALPVVIDYIQNSGGVGGQANIMCHQTLIARYRHNDPAVCSVRRCTSSVACALAV